MQLRNISVINKSRLLLSMKTRTKDPLQILFTVSSERRLLITYNQVSTCTSDLRLVDVISCN